MRRPAIGWWRVFWRVCLLAASKTAGAHIDTTIGRFEAYWPYQYDFMTKSQASSSTLEAGESTSSTPQPTEAVPTTDDASTSSSSPHFSDATRTAEEEFESLASVQTARGTLSATEESPSQLGATHRATAPATTHHPITRHTSVVGTLEGTSDFMTKSQASSSTLEAGESTSSTPQPTEAVPTADDASTSSSSPHFSDATSTAEEEFESLASVQTARGTLSATEEYPSQWGTTDRATAPAITHHPVTRHTTVVGTLEGTSDFMTKSQASSSTLEAGESASSTPQPTEAVPTTDDASTSSSSPHFSDATSTAEKELDSLASVQTARGTLSSTEEYPSQLGTTDRATAPAITHDPVTRHTTVVGTLEGTENVSARFDSVTATTPRPNASAVTSEIEVSLELEDLVRSGLVNVAGGIPTVANADLADMICGSSVGHAFASLHLKKRTRNASAY